MKHLLITVLLLTLTASLSWGAPPAALPTVALTTTDGSTLTADRIGTDAGVLLVLVRKGNPGGIRLLDFLASLDPPLPAGRVQVVVTGADARLLATIAGKYPGLPAQWYRDQSSALPRELRLAVTPAIMGVRADRLAWMQSGLPDTDLLEKTVRGWLNR